MARVALDVRFWSKVAMTDGCWMWTANTSREGYGRISIDGRERYAHRVAYELIVGPVPEGLELDHLCRNTACVRPDHLEPVTHDENMRRRRSAFCRRGHRLEGPRLYVMPNGRRQCRVCRRVADLNRYYRHRERRIALGTERRRRRRG